MLSVMGFAFVSFVLGPVFAALDYNRRTRAAQRRTREVQRRRELRVWNSGPWA